MIEIARLSMNIYRIFSVYFCTTLYKYMEEVVQAVSPGKKNLLGGEQWGTEWNIKEQVAFRKW